MTGVCRASVWASRSPFGLFHVVQWVGSASYLMELVEKRQRFFVSMQDNAGEICDAIRYS